MLIKYKLRWAITAIAVIIGGLYLPNNRTYAERCPALKIIFARGSGAPRNDNTDYQNFRSTLEEKLKLIRLDYEFSDLDYPAVGVDNILTIMGAYFGAGESYKFGNSIDTGV